jgi:hypothetical protein
MHTDYADAGMRMGLVSSHEPVFGMWIIISLLAILFFWPDEYKKARIFLLFIVISLWVATNQQIVTGLALQQAHYHWNITKPVLVSIIVSALFIYSIQRFARNKKIVTGAAVLAASALIYHGVLIQVSSYEYLYQYNMENQKYSDLVTYLSENYNSEQNIFSTQLASVFIPVYTKHNSPNNPFFVYYFNSKEYLSKLLFLEYKLQGIKPEAAGEKIRSERHSASKRIFGIYHREKYGRDGMMPEDDILKLEIKYKEFYDLSYEGIFKDLDIDIVVWDKEADKNFEYEIISSLSQVYNINDEFIIFSTQQEQ